MLYFLSLLTHTDQLAFFRLFRYLTFRSGGAVISWCAEGLSHHDSSMGTDLASCAHRSPRE